MSPEEAARRADKLRRIARRMGTIAYDDRLTRSTRAEAAAIAGRAEEQAEAFDEVARGHGVG